MIERDHIGIFGKMNSGKSTIMNLLTQQKTSIVDDTPGTTADTKITLQEIHGIGPVKLFDTAGYDEEGELGSKKKEKVIADMKECDLVLIVFVPGTGYNVEKDLLLKARELDKQIFVIYNLFDEDVGDDEFSELKYYKKISIVANDEKYRKPLVDFIIENFESKNVKTKLLPFIEKDEYYVLNIPMDEETPPGRYLRPQAMCEEYITRNWGYPVSFRMDLGKARSKDFAKEKKRFEDFISNFKRRPKAIITDSQAMDIMKDWVPDDIELTTFSIMMINYVSRGRLKDFVEGVKQIELLKKGSKVLIVEACNHSRVGEDIGTVQIPNYFEKHLPEVVVDHNFGREFDKKLEDYDLIIHCGGCMISSQKLMARLRDLDSIGVPYTNYGLFLSYIQGQDVLDRVVGPWL